MVSMDFNPEEVSGLQKLVYDYLWDSEGSRLSQRITMLVYVAAFAHLGLDWFLVFLAVMEGINFSVWYFKFRGENFSEDMEEKIEERMEEVMS